MVKCWVVLILVASPIANAWKSSTEDQRDPEYHKDLRQELRDETEYRKAPTAHRKVVTEIVKDPTEYRKNPSEYRKDLTESRKDFTESRKDLTEYRKDPTSYRKDPTGYRREPRELRRVHYHTKRHMLPDAEPKKRSTTYKPTRDMRKKPSGHLTPLDEDDMENDEVISVAIGPPPLRGKFDKKKKRNPKPTPVPVTSSAVGLVKDLFSQITREFLSRDVDENFVFGQYLGNSMKNLTSDLRLSMQHEILELIVKYQKANRGPMKEPEKTPEMLQILKDVKVERKFSGANDTEETWPDFSNLAKIVG